MPPILRLAVPDDASGILNVYAPYIRDTAVTFEYTVPPLPEFTARIEQIQQRFPYFVCEENGASVAIFAWSALEPEEGQYHFEWLDETFDRLWKNGIRIILATPSGARPAWMDEKYPEILRVDESRVRHLHGIRHNHCYTSPVYREKVRTMNRMLAERYGKHPALMMWHISNEYGGECHCPLCQKAFQDWLRIKYDNDIDKLMQRYSLTGKTAGQSTALTVCTTLPTADIFPPVWRTTARSGNAVLLRTSFQKTAALTATAC